MKYLKLVVLIGLLSISCTDPHPQKGKPIAYLELKKSTLAIEEIIDSLGVPWDIDASIPGELWFTEQSGSVYQLNLKTHEKKKVLQVPDVLYKKSYGLLGMTVHPKQPFVFFHYTFQANEDDLQQELRSRLVRYRVFGDTLSEPKILLDNIPGNTYHNGSRLIISPDDKLFFSMGDTGRQNRTQDDSILIGKIMRFNLDGSIPADNPIPGSPIWSRGHRNPQGLAFSNDGTLYSTEHGPNNDDEVNLIKKNNNYGWPDVQGFCNEEWEEEYCSQHHIHEPLKAWTPTIAIAGMAYYNDSSISEWKHSLIVANMKGRAMRVLNLTDDGREITNEHIYFQKEFGRIRDVSKGPNGAIYFTTSNTDWHPRFQPWMYDSLPEGGDRIIRIRAMEEDEKIDLSLPVLKENAEPLDLLSENWNYSVDEEEFAEGRRLFAENCRVCHGPEGQGSEDMYPPLSKSEWITGDKGRLIRTVLLGLSEPIEVNGEMYNQEMPSFRQLSDQEIADILTYVRNSFGNSAGAVIPGEVFEERKSRQYSSNQ